MDFPGESTKQLSSEDGTWSSKWGSSQGGGSTNKLQLNNPTCNIECAAAEMVSRSSSSGTREAQTQQQQQQKQQKQQKPVQGEEKRRDLASAHYVPPKSCLQGTWDVLQRWPVRTAGVSFLLLLLLSGLGTAAVLCAARTCVQQEKEEAVRDADDFANAFTNQLLEVNAPLETIKYMIMANPSYDYWLNNFEDISRQHIETVDKITKDSLEMLQIQPHGMSRLAYPRYTGLMDQSCSDLLGYPKPAVASYFRSIIAQGALVLQGPLAQPDSIRGVVYASAAWIINPVYIANVSKDEDFGYPWSDSPSSLACVEDGTCYNPATKTKWWGFVTAFINLEPLTTGTDARLVSLVDKGYAYRLVAPARAKSGVAKDFLLGQKGFDESGSECVQVDVPVLAGSTWLLEIQPTQGWVPAWRDPLIAAVVVISFIVSLLVLFALVSDLKQSVLLAESMEANRQLAIAKEEADEGRRLVEEERSRMGLLLERQHDLINLVTKDGSLTSSSKGLSAAERIEDLRKCLGDNTRRSGNVDKGGANAVRLMELLGEGSFGKVYRGIWRQTEVAVKTMVLPPYMSGVEKREKMLIMEAAISSALAHPNIVQTYTYSIQNIEDQHQASLISSAGIEVKALGSSYSFKSTSAGGTPNRPSPEPAPAQAHHGYEVCLIIEYCDKGSLQDALKGGALQGAQGLNYRAVLDMAMDIAKAMLHLHLADVLHGDLKCGNVLLKSSGVEGRGVICKVADFGLAVKMDNTQQTHLSNLFQGTLTHMAPELLLYGRMSKAADVYAFAIAMWELYTGARPFEGVPQALLGHQVAHEHKRPRFEAHPPAEFAELVAECWAPAPEHRPSFGSILQRLGAMRAQLPGPTPALSAYALPGAAAAAAAVAAAPHSPSRNAATSTPAQLPNQEARAGDPEPAAPRAFSSKPIVLGSLSAYVRHNRNQLTPVDEESAAPVFDPPARIASYKSEYIEMEE